MAKCPDLCPTCGEHCACDAGLVEALRTIVGPSDSGPYITVYRQAGGGYEGLQAIARAALEGFDA